MALLTSDIHLRMDLGGQGHLQWYRCLDIHQEPRPDYYHSSTLTSAVVDFEALDSGRVVCIFKRDLRSLRIDIDMDQHPDMETDINDVQGGDLTEPYTRGWTRGSFQRKDGETAHDAYLCDRWGVYSHKEMSGSWGKLWALYELTSGHRLRQFKQLQQAKNMAGTIQDHFQGGLICDIQGMRETIDTIGV
jgi:hypothetical protein